MELFIYCAGLVFVIVLASWIVELIYNLNEKNDWRNKITAQDIEDLKTIFETDNEPDMVLYSKFVIK